MTVVDRLSGVLERRLSRRSFVVRSAFAGSALTAGGVDYLVRPGTAYSSLCTCGSSACGCGTTCCAGYTEFCCVINGGYNYCPSDTIMGGWWRAEGSAYCDGPRYYMDCNATCQCAGGCGGGYAFCSPDCDGGSCGCADGSCDNYLTNCFQFRYGQCNQDVGCIGRIKCRVVTCVPPWEIDPTCTTTLAEDDYTANQSAPCVTPGPTPPPLSRPVCGSTKTKCEVVAIAPSATTRGYQLVTAFGRTFCFGDQHYEGEITRKLAQPVTAMAVSPTGGYWFVLANGRVQGFGGAAWAGDTYDVNPRPTVAICAHPGGGYWLLTAGGRVTPFGGAVSYGDSVAEQYPTPFVAMAATPTGNGYWMVTSGGRIRAFGDAVAHGDLSSTKLATPVASMAATSTGGGYWLATEAGSVYNFGDAAFHGNALANKIPYPVVGMAANHSGNGYWLATADGQVFNYGNASAYGNAH